MSDPGAYTTSGVFYVEKAAATRMCRACRGKIQKGEIHLCVNTQDGTWNRRDNYHKKCCDKVLKSAIKECQDTIQMLQNVEYRVKHDCDPDEGTAD